MFHMLGPIMAARKMAKTMAGRASQASVTRMMIWSTHPPTYPDRMPSAVPRPPATSVPISPTISDTRAPWIRRLRMSRPRKSVPRGVTELPPSIQRGGSNTLAPLTGSVGSWGAMRSAKIASIGASPSVVRAAASRPVAGGRARGRSPAMVAIVRSARQPDPRVDQGVEDVHDQVDPDDHDAGHDHHALHEREVA